MELHENLYALGLRLGREVFDDPDSFRGALDDFLDEDAATTGDINLLVDAVRLGAFGSMTSMLGSGAQVTAAVEEAGSRLARDRGSADVAGAQWACAVLGFAIGKVSDAEVRRYRTQHAHPAAPVDAAAAHPVPRPAAAGRRPARRRPPQYPAAPVTRAPPPGTGPLADGPADVRRQPGEPCRRAGPGPPQSWPGHPGSRPSRSARPGRLVGGDVVADRADRRAASSRWS